MELGRLLLIDERRGRRETDRLNVPKLSTLLVLQVAKEHGSIPAVRPILQQLRDDKFRLKQDLFDQFLADLGE